MTFKTGSALAVLFAATLAGAASAQTPAADWRTVAPENLLIIETAKGRVLVELEPRAAPGHVERIRTLASRGFYDGLKFHRVIPNFMAQTGDPQGTGQGGSDLPDLPAEIEFRRGRDSGFVAIPDSGEGVAGIMGSIPIQTQPDAQMMVTADFRVDANGLFCPGVAGMARSQGMDSANSQFFLMTGARDNLNGAYTVFGRVVDGLDAVKALNAGLETQNGTVENPDVMTRVRIATQLPEGERPVVRVQTLTSAAFTEVVAAKRAERGNNFSVCDVQPAAEVTGG